MNTEFKFQVAGPYQPLNMIEIKEFPGEKFYRKSKIATLETVLELAGFYRSVLCWRSHNKAMVNSMFHTATMMGEVDDPDENAQDSYNPVAYAGLFSIFFVFQTIDCYDSKKNRRLPENVKESACGIITQLMFALSNDDDALAQYAKYIRTGFIGTPSDKDAAEVQKCREFVRKVSRLSEEMERAFLLNQYDIPLQKRLWGYDRERGHYWSEPIVLPEITVEEEDY